MGEGRLLEPVYRRSEDPKTPPKWATYLVLGAGADGEMYLPCLTRKHTHPEPWWDRTLNLRRPGHWPYALLSAVTGWFVWLDG